MIDPVPLLQALIRTPSCDPPGGEVAAARVVHEAMQGAGLESDLDEFRPDRANVIGRLPGRGEAPALVFSAHLDTLPPGGRGWTADPFAGDLVDGRVLGRGAADMKSAVAAFVAAASALARRDAPLGGDVILAFTAGESADCLGARHLAANGFKDRIGAFLCGEPSTLDLIVVEKAILWLEAVAEGEVGHISGTGGLSAIDLMVAFLGRLKGLTLDVPRHPLLDGPSISVGTIQGGTAVNLTPDLCTASLDVRFGPGVEPDDVAAQIAAVAPDAVTLQRIDFKPAVEEPADSPFVACCAQAVAAETGRDPRRLGVSYYSDGAILMDGVDAPFCILGPGGLGLSGTADEWVDAAAVRQAARIYARIAEHWLA